MLHLKNFTPDLQKFTQINLSYLWYFTTLHHAKMSSEYDPDDAHYDDPGYDAYWHGYNHGHRDGYDKGTCCIINIIILSTMTIIITITRLFKRRVPRCLWWLRRTVWFVGFRIWNGLRFLSICSPSSPMLLQFPICFSNPPNLAPVYSSPMLPQFPIAPPVPNISP